MKPSRILLVVAGFSMVYLVFILVEQGHKIHALELQVMQLTSHLDAGLPTAASQVPPPSAPSPPNIPGRRKPDENVDKARGIYGGKGDGAHLGGFTGSDEDGQSPAVWSFLLELIGIRSVLDVGCGKGISTKWFLDHGADVLCVEGSHDAVTRSLLPPDKVVEHDVYEGPWWPEKTYDLVWSVEFLEHIGRHKIKNYLPMLRKGGILILTSSTWGGFHHVEVHKRGWWIERMRGYGFVYSRALTMAIRRIGRLPDGFRSQHLMINSHVYLNPAVLSLPEHDHIFGSNGCYAPQNVFGAACKAGVEHAAGVTDFDILPERYNPLIPIASTNWSLSYAQIWEEIQIDSGSQFRLY